MGALSTLGRRERDLANCHCSCDWAHTRNRSCGHLILHSIMSQNLDEKKTHWDVMTLEFQNMLLSRAAYFILFRWGANRRCWKESVRKKIFHNGAGKQVTDMKPRQFCSLPGKAIQEQEQELNYFLTSPPLSHTYNDHECLGQHDELARACFRAE